MELDRADQNGRPNFVKVEAYRDDPDPEYANNPMALVFPPPQSDADIYNALFEEPHSRPEKFLTWPVEHRLQYLEFMDEFHYVFAEDIALSQKVVALIRKSFYSRNPANPRVLNAIMRLMSGQEVKTPRTSGAGAGGGLGVIVYGLTGVGKTAMLDRLVAFIGDYGRFHQSLNGEPAQWPQLGVIRVNAENSWKDVLKSILAEIDRQLGRDYYLKRERSSSGPRLKAVVHEALTAGFAPLLVIDELQRVARLTQERALEILQGLIDMMGVWGIPVVVVGTVRVHRLLERFPAEMDKFSNGGVRNIKPLELGSADTENFIDMLKAHSVSLTPIQYSQDFNVKLMSHCMGVKRIMREYMKVVLTRHANDEDLLADGALLNEIADTELKRFQKALSVLRKRFLGIRVSSADFQDYEDYLPLDSKTPTRAQIQLDARWRMNNQTSLAAADSPDVSADDFAGLVDWLTHEQGDDRRKAESESVTRFDEGFAKEAPPPRAEVPVKRKSARKKATEQLKIVSNVVPLGAMRPPKPSSKEAIDPSGEF